MRNHSMSRDGTEIRPELYPEEVEVIREALDLLEPIALRENARAIGVVGAEKQGDLRRRAMAIHSAQGVLRRLWEAAEARWAGEPPRAYSLSGARSPWGRKGRK
jgi:hypothetical protein